MTVVGGAELGGPSAECPDERERRRNSVESKPPHELQSFLGLALDLIEWMARGKKDGTKRAEGGCGKSRIAVLSCHLEGPTRRIGAFAERSCPRDESGE
jgi:hypothetical protein